MKEELINLVNFITKDYWMNNINKHINSSNINQSIDDDELSNAMQKELNRQQNSIELIASENFVSQAVLDVQGLSLIHISEPTRPY